MMFKRYLMPLISFLRTALVLAGKKLQKRMSYPKSFPIRTVNQTTNQVTFRLKQEQGPFRIYRDARLIYEGDDESFTDKDLKTGTTYIYSFEIGARRGKQERLKVQTSTASDFRESDNVLKNCILTTVISRSLVGMEWEPLDGVSEYHIYRNGKRIAKVEEPAFVDRWVRSQVEYTYRIIAARPLREQEKDSDERRMSRFSKKVPKKHSVAIERFQMTKMLDPLEEILQSDHASSEKKEWRVLYKTFQPKNWVKNHDAGGSPYRYFKGDGRGFDPASPDFRSMAEIIVTGGDAPIPAIHLEKNIGETKGYGMVRNLKKVEKASDKGIFIEDIELIGKQQVSFMLQHSVPNPLADAPAVNYQVWAKLYQNGFYDIAGIHEQNPSHEVYLKHGPQRLWRILHQSEDEGVERTAPMHWRVSNFK